MVAMPKTRRELRPKTSWRSGAGLTAAPPRRPAPPQQHQHPADGRHENQYPPPAAPNVTIGGDDMRGDQRDQETA